MNIKDIKSRIEGRFDQFAQYAFEMSEYSIWDDQRSELHHDMNELGKRPLLGIFSGAIRLAYGGVKTSLGICVTILSAAPYLVSLLIKRVAYPLFEKYALEKITTHFESCKKFTKDGAFHLGLGLIEVGTLGFCERIRRAIYPLVKMLRGDREMRSRPPSIQTDPPVIPFLSSDGDERSALHEKDLIDISSSESGDEAFASPPVSPFREGVIRRESSQQLERVPSSLSGRSTEPATPIPVPSPSPTIERGGGGGGGGGRKSPSMGYGAGGPPSPFEERGAGALAAEPKSPAGSIGEMAYTPEERELLALLSNPTCDLSDEEDGGGPAFNRDGSPFERYWNAKVDHGHYVSRFVEVAPPMDERVRANFSNLLIEIIKDTKLNHDLLNLADHSIAKALLIIKYRKSLLGMVDISTGKWSLLNPLSILKSLSMRLLIIPLRVMATCLEKGEILESAKRMQRDTPEQWNNFAKQFAEGILYMQPDLFSDPTTVTGFLIHLGLDPQSHLFKDLIQKIDAFEIYRRHPPFNSAEIVARFLPILNDLLERDI